GLVLLVGGGGVLGWNFLAREKKARADIIWQRVGYGPLQLTIVERGQLESADNRDIVCRVKARSQNSTVATTIRWVIDDGTEVVEGDKLIELDDSGLQEQLKQQRITMINAQIAWEKAEGDYRITKIENKSAIETAKLNWELTKIDLKKYADGDYPQALRE